MLQNGKPFQSESMQPNMAPEEALQFLSKNTKEETKVLPEPPSPINWKKDKGDATAMGPHLRQAALEGERLACRVMQDQQERVSHRWNPGEKKCAILVPASGVSLHLGRAQSSGPRSLRGTCRSAELLPPPSGEKAQEYFFATGGCQATETRLGAY
ncbi:uncharacterized protein LOC105708159 isoform X2 [Aotus nancymaae]|uniref:uncharacterized protein LOC105708159 isoform X2 n=1 Tax=Aotus nancymaae TaxID=37293 RepID=UPI0030FEE63C